MTQWPLPSGEHAPIPYHTHTCEHSAASLPPSLPLTQAPLPTTTHRTLFKTAITITVSPTCQPFTVHGELLCRESAYFAACLNRRHGFVESTTNTIHLRADRADAFEFFVQWLYTRRLEHEAVDARPPAFFPLLHLYALADKLGVEALRNDVVDRVARLADERNTVPAPDDTRILYGEIREAAPVRRLVVDLFVRKRTERVVVGHGDSWDERFLRDLVVRLKREVRGGSGSGSGRERGEAPWVEDICGNYHEHAKGTEGGCKARK